MIVKLKNFTMVIAFLSFCFMAIAAFLDRLGIVSKLSMVSFIFLALGIVLYIIDLKSAPSK